MISIRSNERTDTTAKRHRLQRDIDIQKLLSHWPFCFSDRTKRRILPHHHRPLYTIRLPSHKLAVRRFTAANARIWIHDTTRTLAVTLALIAPEESPVIRISSYLVGGSRRSAGVGFAGSVGCAVDGIVLVVCFEDGEGLGLVGACVVAAFGGLDGVAGC
jgi:hypothetical protein